MSEFLGSRISLISKSDIRYVGVLHQINSEESTVSLENVRSFGSEGRKGRPEEEIPPSDQVYEYIIFRGSDVKDLRIENAPGIKENNPPAMPEDPAIVGARPRPEAERQSQPPGPGGFGQHPPQNSFYPPPGPWGPQGGPSGRGAPGPGPGPGPGPAGNMPYPPPPGWFPPGHPGQNFPPPPGHWAGNNFSFPPGQPMPPGPGPEHPVPGQGPGPVQPGPPGSQDQHRAGPGKGPQQQQQQPQTSTPQPASRPKSAAQQQGGQQGPAPTPPVDSKPSTEEVKATAATLDQAGPSKGRAGNVPTGPKNNRVMPVVPLASPQSAPPPAHAGVPANNAAIRDATQAAKAAVALAMANLNGGNGAQPPQASGPAVATNVDNLTRRVDEMRVNASRGGQAGRGRGRGGRPGPKIEVPESDFNFDEANAKFNKGDLVKEAIAGSPLNETPTNGSNVEESQELPGDPPVAYDKKSSFFDNISSEAKDREKSGQKAGGREWRGEEQRKNMETFGQGSVDGGHRGYRGRGRGRGRGYGGRGRGGGYRGRGGQNASPAVQN